MLRDYQISPLSEATVEELQKKIDLKTKPIGALGKLEHLAIKMGSIQQTTSPTLKNPHIAVFAGDHGIAKEGLVNPYPQEVTYQMVMNFLSGGAAINVLSNQNNIAVKVVDAGVNFDFGETPGLIDAKIDFGTANYLEGQAMSIEQSITALHKGGEIVENIHREGSNIIGFGEMGIGNTSSASLIMSKICGVNIEDCIGKGTGVDDEQLKLKIETLIKVVEKHKGLDKENPLAILSTFGGFEIAQICGGMLRAAELGMVILVDGFISTAALLLAQRINKNVLDYTIFTHHSNEQGHGKMLDYLRAEPLINLEMRLGEGSGIAVAFPIIQAACTFLNEMASFEDAGVSNK